MGGSDGLATTTAIFNVMSSYEWDAKLVLFLSAFVFNYGELWLSTQKNSTNQLVESIEIPRQLPLMDHIDTLNPRFDAIENSIRAMMNVTRCVVEIKELPSKDILKDLPAFATAMTHIPTAIYWAIRSMVACATQINVLSRMGHEYVFHVHLIYNT